MQMKRRVALNGNQLDEVDSRIVISAVEPGDGRENISAADTAGGFGQRITAMHRSTLDVIVRFRILEHGRSTDGMAAREAVLEKVNAWAAGGGALTVGYKTGRRLNVVLAQAPGPGSMWDYTKEFQLVFRAYAIPYWEDASQSAAEIAAGGSNILIRGSAEAQVNAQLTNAGSGAISEATISIGGVAMSFEGLGLAAGEVLVIDHTEDGLLRIRINNDGTYRSAMAKRTSGSADDFLIGPGTKNCYCSTDGDAALGLTWRNRYL